MRRFQVKTPGRSWDDRGPDLLRSRSGASDAAVELLPRGFYVGRVGRDLPRHWIEIGPRRRVGPWLDSALATISDGETITLALSVGRDSTPRAIIRARSVAVRELQGADPRVELTNALLETAFPASVFSGAFVCKETSPGYWSDHGWGHAGDRTHRPPAATNDAMTDWLARMAKAGEAPVVQILGSRRGQVVEARNRVVGAWNLRACGASVTHLFHVHYSVVDHRGARPPCAR